MQTFISFEEARRLVLDAVPKQPEESVELDRALGRTFSRSVQSPCNIPSFDNSAMDGYAVNSADLSDVPAHLPIGEEIAAGDFPQRAVKPGTCAEIMTGAPLPSGTDAVVPIEWTSGSEGGIVQINRTVATGQHVRLAAGDVQKDQILFEEGEVVTPPVVAMLAMIGVTNVPVRRAPLVAIIATGNELVDVSEEPGPGQLRNANGPALAAQVRTAGGVPLTPSHSRDGLQPLRATAEKALEADVLVFSGGVSVGKHDYVKEVLDSMGMQTLFWKVRQRPGKPLVFGMLHGKPVFGLPGNPAAAAICFEQYVRPALAAVLGRKTVVRTLYGAQLSASVQKKSGLHYFSRGRVSSDDTGCMRVGIAGSQSSGNFEAMARANCLFHMPEPMENPTAGTRVQFEWLTWGI